MPPASEAYGTHQGEPRDGPFPLAARVGAIVVGLALAVYFTSIAASLYAQGFVLTGVVLPLTVLPFGLFLVLVGLIPGAMQRMLSRVSRVDLRDGGHDFALIVLTVALFMIFGFGSIVNGVFAFETVVVQGEGQDVLESPGESALLQGLLVNLVLLAAPPLIWLTFVNEHSLLDAFRALGFRTENLGKALLAGATFALAVIVVLVVVSLALERGGVQLPDNERARSVAESLSIAAAVAVAALSSVSEEVLFRGFLFPRVGMIAQSVLFALAHLSYVHALQIVVTFVLALGFAWLYKRTGSLWAPISAHFTFNLVMLVAGAAAAS